MKEQCKIEGCVNRVKARGWCHNHYERWRKNGDPTISGWEIRRQRNPKPRATTEKRCAICKKVKPADQFYNVYRDNDKGNHGWYLSAYCKPCHSEYHAVKFQKEMEERGPVPRKNQKHDGPCAFEGCTKRAASRYRGQGPWLCPGHWQQRAAGTELRPLRIAKASYINDKVRRCTGCDTIKGVSEFYVRADGKRQSRCKECAVLASNFMQMLRLGNHTHALELAQRMPERLKKKYMGKLPTQINGSEFERSNSGEGQV